MKTEEDWISLREFARRVEVNPFSVQQALENGRLTRRSDKKIHWPSQSKAWDELRDPSKVRDDLDDEESQGEEPTHFQQAKLRKEKAIAGLKELELQEALGEVVKASYVEYAMTQFAIDVRDAVMTIPDRVASVLAAEISKLIPGPAIELESVEELVRRFWKQESRLALETIARADRSNKR